MKRNIIGLSFLFFATLIGCKKDYLEVIPSDAVTEQQLFSDLSNIYAAMDGITKELFTNGTGVVGSVTRHDNFGQKSFDLASDLMGNDMVVHSQGYGWFNSDYNYTEWGNPAANRQSDLTWYYYYDIIKQANKILRVVDGATGAANDREIIKGQAYAIRAYAYYYLINYFQQSYKGNETKPGVPIYPESQTTLEAKGRGKVGEVYDQIISDLTKAETLLTGKARASLVNIDVQVVQGFRARVALLMEDWPTAATYAGKAKTGYSLMNASEYTALSAFSSISTTEWMWGSSIPEAQATIYASFFSHMDINTGGYAALGGQKKITKALYDQIAAGDVRKNVFTAPGTGSGANVDYNQVKHQVPSPGSWAADYLYMRASEMFLIEAEAKARQGNDAGARSVLELMVQVRYPAYSAGTFSGQALIDEILLQRRIELWGEGFSLMDIKRIGLGLNRPTGTGNHGAPSYNPAVYTTGPNEPRFLMRIPQRELDTNVNMTAADQNP